MPTNAVNPAGAITVFAPGTGPNKAPIFTIQGPATQLNQPNDIAFDTAGNIYVANFGGNSITRPCSALM